MTWALVLDADRYRERVEGTPLEDLAKQWMRRIALAAHGTGGDVNDKGEAIVVQARWDGEHARLQLLRRDARPADIDPDDEDAWTLWWTPTEPPPPALMAHAERVAHRAQSCPQMPVLP